MKTILLFIVLIAIFILPIPCIADTGTGVSIPLTVTVTGGGGGGGWFGSNGSFPYIPPDFKKMFPTMEEAESSAPVDNRPIQTNPPVYIPPVVGASAKVPEPPAPVITPIQTTPAMDKAVWAGILFWAIVIGVAVWGLSWVVDKKREKKVQ